MPVRFADAVDVAAMLVWLGRAVPPGIWVDSFVARAQADREAMLPHNRT